MLRNLFREIERRSRFDSIPKRFANLFDVGNGVVQFRENAFEQLSGFLKTGDYSFQEVAVQVGVKWASASQKVSLRNSIISRGFITPSCLWAYRQLRGAPEDILVDFESPEMSYMQILLLKEIDPGMSAPFQIEKFVSNKQAPDEIRETSRLCCLRLLDYGMTPALLKSLQQRYPGVEILKSWTPCIPGAVIRPDQCSVKSFVDFHQLVRSLRNLKELSSLTRVLYILSSFYVPLTEKEFHSLLLSQTDVLFFNRLKSAGIVECHDSGFALTCDPSKQGIIKKFLYDSYPLAKDSLNKNRVARKREDREKRVRTLELDRHALEMTPDGVICVDHKTRLYYMNKSATGMLSDSTVLKNYLFGKSSLDEELRNYSPERLLYNVSKVTSENGDTIEVFGRRVEIGADGRRFEIQLEPQVILIRDITDQFLVSKEIGKLYRHELGAALDVMGIGLQTAKQMIVQSKTEEALNLVNQVESKRIQLTAMLEERIDFIRLHSDSFRITPSVVNLNVLLEKCMANYRQSAVEKKIAITTNNLRINAIYVNAEERFLCKLFDNLIRNAIKFSNASGSVRLTLGTKRTEAFIKLEDDGIGIPDKNLAKIFKLGFTTGGTGRGLYLARKIAMAHSGRIEVKSREGHGSCFTVFLPVCREI